MQLSIKNFLKSRKKKWESKLDDQGSSEFCQSPSIEESRKEKLVKSQKKSEINENF